MNIIDTSSMTRDEWLALRRQSIGASDAPVIAGLSTYKSRFQLWLEKTGQGEPDEAGEQARWGNRLEDDILAELVEFHGVVPMFTQYMVYAEEYPWMHATLDMIEESHRHWQFKASGIAKAKSLVDGDNASLPNDWIIQVHHEMVCSGQREAGIATFIGHRLQLSKWIVPYDEEIGQGVIQLVSEFKDHVESMTPPTDFDPQDAAVLLRHYRQIDDDVIVSEDEKLRMIAQHYETAQAKAKFQAELADQCKASLLAQMKTAAAMRCGPYLMKRSTVNVKASTPKSREASSYIKFTFTNTEREDS